MKVVKIFLCLTCFIIFGCKKQASNNVNTNDTNYALTTQNLNRDFTLNEHTFDYYKEYEALTEFFQKRFERDITLKKIEFLKTSIILLSFIIIILILSFKKH